MKIPKATMKAEKKFTSKELAHQLEPAGCKKSMNFEQANDAIQNGEVMSQVAEIKFDGLRYLWQIRPNGAKHNYLTSRRISVETGRYVEKQDKVPFLKDVKNSPQLHADTVFDGEIISENGISSDTQHEMVTGNVKYVIWDILMLDGHDLRKMPFKQRRQLLVAQKRFLPKGASIVETHRPWKALSLAKEQKLEGIIIKDPEAPYGKGWIKVKEEKHADVIIWGYEETKSKDWAAKGWIGALKIGMWRKSKKKPQQYAGSIYLERSRPEPGELLIIDDFVYEFTDVGRASGFDQVIREDISKNQRRYLGQVIEIEYQLQFPSGKFRSPRFNRFRHDKNAINCRISN